MVVNADQAIWTLPGEYGPELWTVKQNRFAEVSVGQKKIVINQNALDADLGQLALRKGTCVCDGPWPNAFQFCPNCGAPMAAPKSAIGTDGTSWTPPYGTDGERGQILGGNAPDVSLKRQQILPDRANLSFVVAGTPSALICYDHNNGNFKKLVREDAFQAPVEAWIDLGRLPSPSRLPRWSWSAAASAHGFALPTGNGMCWMDIEPDRERRIVQPPERFKGMRCVGGVAWARGMAIAPVERDGGLFLLSFTPSDDDNWSLVEVEPPPASGLPGLFAVPIVHGSEIFWVGVTGHIYFDINTSRAAYIGWPEDFTPHEYIKPLWTPDGSIYQQGRNGSNTIFYQKIRRPGDLAQGYELRGYALISDQSLFFDGKRYPRLGESEFESEYILDDGEFVLPLMAFSNRRHLLAVCPERSSLRDFIGVSTQQKPPRKCRLVYSGATRSMEPLNQVIPAATALDITAFAFSGRIFVYSSIENRCWSWPLIPTSGGVRF